MKSTRWLEATTVNAEILITPPYLMVSAIPVNCIENADGLRLSLQVKHKNLANLIRISVMVLIGISLSLFGWNRANTDVRLDQRNEVIEGKVLDAFISTGMRGGTWSHLVVEYEPPNHEPIRHTFDVDGATYKTSLETRKATVFHLPEDPQVSRVTRLSPLPFQILIWLGGLIALAGFITFALFLRNHNKPEIA